MRKGPFAKKKKKKKIRKLLSVAKWIYFAYRYGIVGANEYSQSCLEEVFTQVSLGKLFSLRKGSNFNSIKDTLEHDDNNIFHTI